MKYIFIIIFLVFVLSTSAQKGSVFPQVKGKNLEEQSVSIPFSDGRYSLIAIAFHRQAEEDLKKWLNPLYDAFIPAESGSSSKGIDMAEVHDVNFMFIPVIAGFKRVSDEFKKDTDKKFWKYVLDTEKTDIKLLQDKLNVDDNKVPYFFVLDQDGKVVEIQQGKFSQAKLDKLEAAVQ